MVKNFGEFERIFGGLWLKSTLSFAIRDYFLNGGTEAIIVRLVKNARTARYILPTSDESKNLVIVALNPGSWGNRMSISINYKTRNPNDPSLFNLIVKERNGQREIFRNVSIDVNSPDYLPGVLNRNSTLISVLQTNGQYACPDIRPERTIQRITVNSEARGSNGSILTIREFTAGSGLESNREGLWALEKADIFNLLCIPPYSANRDIGADLIATVVDYCEKKRAIFIIDPLSGWSSEELAHNDISDTSNSYPGTQSSNAALYFPRMVKPNPLRNNNDEVFVPCGAVAGIIAATDAHRGIWKAPAGTEAIIKGISGLTVALDNAENESLNRLGVNCIRSFPVQGHLLWGARTLAGADILASEWKYLPVRRTSLYIEESLYRGLQWVVFEPNDETLWSKIRESVTIFMDQLFRQGVFQGASTKDAYFVKCDSQTTTQNDISLGHVSFVVGFAPLKPAEFVILNFRMKVG